MTETQEDGTGVYQYYVRILQQYTLVALLPAIENIDSGCQNCIGEFVDDANRELEKADIPWRYRFDKGDDFVTVLAADD